MPFILLFFSFSSCFSFSLSTRQRSGSLSWSLSTVSPARPSRRSTSFTTSLWKSARNGTTRCENSSNNRLIRTDVTENFFLIFTWSVFVKVCFKMENDFIHIEPFKASKVTLYTKVKNHWLWNHSLTLHSGFWSLGISTLPSAVLLDNLFAGKSVRI